MGLKLWLIHLFIHVFLSYDGLVVGIQLLSSQRKFCYAKLYETFITILKLSIRKKLGLCIVIKCAMTTRV